jgi:CRP/FNR family cyclic AMP-dependent transcriptional regulator
MAENLERIIAEHPFAKDLDPRYFDLLVGCARNVRFEAGEFLFREGDEANQFYLIRHGVVALEVYAGVAGQVNVMTIGEGEVLGWSWLFAPYRWKFDARAVELTRAIALDGKCLRTKCEADHDLGYELLKRFAYMVEQRLDATRLQLLDVYGSKS